MFSILRPNASGIVLAWEELLAAAAADPGLAQGASFRYDVVDVVRQALQDLFAKVYSRPVQLSNTTRGFAHPPFQYYKGIPSSPSDITRGFALPPF